MAALAGLNDIVTALIATLAPVTTTAFFGRRAKGTNVDYPAYFMYPLETESFSSTLGPGGSGNPRGIAGRECGVTIECWGSDYGPAENLMYAAITAIRSTVSGANYRIVGGAWVDAANIDRGQLYILQVMFRTVVPQVDLATLTDAAYPTTIPTQGGFDASVSVFGDGKLDAGEPA